MISTEPGPDDVLEAWIRQALAEERFTVPTATITGRMSRRRRRTWVAVVTMAVATGAAIVPVLTSLGTDRAPAIKTPVILPGPTGTTLDEACRSAGLAWLATGANLWPEERSALPPLRFASDLDGLRVYASKRVHLACRWSPTEGRVLISSVRPPTPKAGQFYGRDLDAYSELGQGRGYVIGGTPFVDVAAVEIKLVDGRVVPAHVDGDLFAAWWDGSGPGTEIDQITAIGQRLIFRRTGLAADPGSEMVLVADPLGNACKRELPFPASLIAASTAMGYRIYGGHGDQVAVCVATGDPSTPVQLKIMNVPAATAGVVVPTVATVLDRAGALGLVMGRGDARDIELQVGGERLRPAIRDGFYAAAVRGVFTSSGLTRWVYVDPAIIYTGTGTTVTAAIPRE